MIIVGGLVLGIFTPSEAGAFAVVYALVLAMFVHRVSGSEGPLPRPGERGPDER